MRVFVSFFWNQSSISLLDLLEQGSTVNGEYYIVSLKITQRSHQKEKTEKNLYAIKLYHYNGLPDLNYKPILCTNGVVSGFQFLLQPWSCTIRLAYLWHNENAFQYSSLSDTEGVKAISLKRRLEGPLQIFPKCFSEIGKRWCKCAECKRDYFQ